MTRQEVLSQTFNYYNITYPRVVSDNNCADKMVATDRLLIVACIGTGHLDIIIQDGVFNNKLFVQDGFEEGLKGKSFIAEDLTYIEY